MASVQDTRPELPWHHLEIAGQGYSSQRSRNSPSQDDVDFCACVWVGVCMCVVAWMGEYVSLGLCVWVCVLACVCGWF